jgi:hypothetical protein
MNAQPDIPDGREALAYTLKMACPIRYLAVATPWHLLPEREAWRVIADAALAWCGPSPADKLMAEIRDQQVSLLAMVDEFFALRPYARHLEGCAQTPCSCGFAALLDARDTPQG